MKKLLVSIAVVLFLVCAADAAQPKISPDRINTSQPFPSISMDENANITLNGGYLVDAKLGQSSPLVTVGPYDYCDYVTDGTHDEVEINAAIDSLDLIRGGEVRLVGDLYIVDYIDPQYHCNLTLSGPGCTIYCAGNTGILVRCHNSQFRDFTLMHVGRNSSSAGFKFLDDNGGTQIILDSLWVHGFEKEIYFTSTGYWPSAPLGMHHIRNCILGGYDDIGCNYSIFIERACTVQVTGCTIVGYEFAGIYVERCDSMKILNNVIISVTDSFGGERADFGILVNPWAGDQLIADMTIANNAIENTDVSAIWLDGNRIYQVFIYGNEINGYNHGIIVDTTGASEDFRSIFITSNSMLDYRTVAGGRPIYLTGYNISDSHISGNAIDAQSTNGFSIKVEGNEGIVISDNTIQRGTTTQVEGLTLIADNSSISGNCFIGSGTVINAINVATGSDRVAVIGNTGTVGAITNSGTNCEVAHNT